jgi:nucleoside-diphosphate-sugar epimerase
MKALVTGATGFVGGHLVEALLRAGSEVTALTRSPAKAALLDRLGVRQVRGDLEDRSALSQAVQGQNVVFHVAGLIAARDEAEFLRANRGGTANLLEALRAEWQGRRAAAPPRVVHVSSMAAAGPSEPGRPLTGAERPAPVSSYGRSKLAGEEILRASDLPWTIVRPPMVYGPRDTEVLKVFRLARLGVVPVFGPGTQELSAIYAADLAAALIAAGTSDTAIGQTYYACHAEVFSSTQFVEAVGQALEPARRRPVRTIPLPRWLAGGALSITEATARLTGRATILTPDKANEFFQPAWAADPGPLMRDTGWKPASDLAAGLTATARWYREQGWL